MIKKKKKRHLRANEESNLNLEKAPWSVKAQEVSDPIHTIRELQMFKNKQPTNNKNNTTTTEKKKTKPTPKNYLSIFEQVFSLLLGLDYATK